MRTKYIALSVAALMAAAFSTVALSDWVAKDATGLNITFDAFSNGAKVLPKHVLANTSGTQVGTTANPFSTAISSGGNTAAVTASSALKIDGSAVTQPTTASQSGSWSVSIGSALPTGSNTIGNVGQSGSPWGFNFSQVLGTTHAASNPLFTQPVQSGAVVTPANPMAMNCVIGCSSSESTLKTYSSSDDWTVAGTTPTDIATLSGSATRTVKIRRITITGTNASASNASFNFIKRTTVNTGGTSTTPVVVSHDSTDSASTAVFRTYTANPATLGTNAGVFRNVGMTMGTLATYTPSQQYEFGGLNSKPIVLRGTSESLSINVAANAAGSNMHVSVEWTEE